jgi:hypothetical protein
VNITGPNGLVSFTLSSFEGAAHTTGVIQANSPSDGFKIPINKAGYSIVYVLVNSAFGEIGSTVGSLTFRDAVGNGYTISLEEGVNVRDHYVDFNNVATEVYGTAQYPGDVKLDAYEYFLPAPLATRWPRSPSTASCTPASRTGSPSSPALPSRLAARRQSPSLQPGP